MNRLVISLGSDFSGNMEVFLPSCEIIQEQTLTDDGSDEDTDEETVTEL